MDLKDPRSSFPEFTDPPTVRRAPQRASPNDIEMGDADLYIRLPQVEDDAASIRNEAHNPHSDVMGDMFQSAQGDRRPTPAPGGGDWEQDPRTQELLHEIPRLRGDRKQERTLHSSPSNHHTVHTTRLDNGKCNPILVPTLFGRLQRFSSRGRGRVFRCRRL